MIRWKGYRHHWAFLGEDKYVNKTLTSTKTIRLIGDGEMGEGVRRWGEREIIYLSLHCYHQNDSCIKMGSDESHFNVSIGSDGQSHGKVSTNHNLSERERRTEAVSNRGPSAYQTNALPLGQIGSHRQSTRGRLCMKVQSVYWRMYFWWG